MTNGPLIVALDLGSTFGYAKGCDGVIASSGEVALSCKDAHPGHRVRKFQEWLYNNAREAKEILFENVTGFKGSDAAKMHGRLLGQLELFCLVHGIRMSCLTPMQIKEDFTGYKMAKKEVLCDVAMNLGWKNGVRGTRDNNNECDAIALMWVVYTRRCIQPSFA